MNYKEMRWFILFVTTGVVTLVNAQTSSPTTGQPTTAQVIGNTCSACTTSSCVYYRHAYGPNVEEVTIGCASPTLSPTCVAQSGNFGVGASGVYSFGGADTQVNIASISPTGAGATKKLNIGANAVTATSQEINIGASTSGVITVGGTASTVNVRGTVTIAGPNNNVFVGHSTTPSPGATNSILIGGTSAHLRIGEHLGPGTSIELGAGSSSGPIVIGSSGTPVTIAPSITSPATVNIGAGASTGTVTIGSSTSSAQAVNIAQTTSGTIRVGGGTSTVTIAENVASPATVSIASAQSTGTLYLGAYGTPMNQNVIVGESSSGLVRLGGPLSQVNIASVGASTGTITIGTEAGASQNVNIATGTTGTIKLGGSLTASSPRQTIQIGGTQTPSTTESTDVIFNTYHYLNNIGLFKVQQTPTTPTLAPVTYFNTNSFNQAIGLPYYPTPTPGSSPNYARYLAPSPVNTVIQPCPSNAPTTVNAGANLLFSQNNDCIVLKQPGIYQICVGGITSSIEPSEVSLRRVSCRGAAGVAFPCNTPSPSPTCPTAPISSPSPVPFPTTITPSTPGTSDYGSCLQPQERDIFVLASKGTVLPHQCVTVAAPSSPSDANGAPVAYAVTYYANNNPVTITQETVNKGVVSVTQIGVA